MCSPDDYQTWISVPGMLNNRCGHCAVTTFDNSIIALGGYHSGYCYLDSVERFDTGREIWTALPPMSQGKSGAVAELGIYGEIYSIGGSTNGTNALNLIERLDVREGIWQPLQPMKQERGYFSGCKGHDNQIYVSGGLHNGTFQPSIEVFDPRMGVWRLLKQYDQQSHMAVDLSRAGHSMFFVM